MNDTGVRGSNKGSERGWSEGRGSAEKIQGESEEARNREIGRAACRERV